MAVLDHIGYKSYDGDDVTVAFEFDYKIFVEADLEVSLVTDSDGSIAVQTLNSDYTVAATNNDFENGGTVTMTVAPASGETLVITRDLDIAQDSGYPLSGALPSDQFQQDLDRINIHLQTHSEILGRCLKYPKSDVGINPELPAAVNCKSRYLFGDSSDGEPTMVESVDPGAVTISAFAETLLDDADAVSARSTLGVGDRGQKGVASTNYTILDDDTYWSILVTTGAADRTITLPTLADNLNRRLRIVKVDTGVGKVIIDGEGAETVEGATTQNLIGKDEWVDLHAGASDWEITARGGHGLVETAGNYTVLDVMGDETVVAVTSGGSDRTITLPTLADNFGKKVTVTKGDSGVGAVIIDGEGAETIVGKTTIEMTAQYESVTLVADSNEWLIVKEVCREVLQATDSTNRALSSASWTNAGSLSLAVTPGVWKISYRVLVIVSNEALDNYIATTLSTANNSESDTDMTAHIQGSASAYDGCTLYLERRIDISADTTYYLNALLENVGKTGSCLNGTTPAIIEAVRIGY